MISNTIDIGQYHIYIVMPCDQIKQYYIGCTSANYDDFHKKIHRRNSCNPSIKLFRKSSNAQKIIEEVENAVTDGKFDRKEYANHYYPKDVFEKLIRKILPIIVRFDGVAEDIIPLPPQIYSYSYKSDKNAQQAMAMFVRSDLETLETNALLEIQTFFGKIEGRAKIYNDYIHDQCEKWAEEIHIMEEQRKAREFTFPFKKRKYDTPYSRVFQKHKEKIMIEFNLEKKFTGLPELFDPEQKNLDLLYEIIHDGKDVFDAKKEKLIFDIASIEEELCANMLLYLSKN